VQYSEEFKRSAVEKYLNRGTKPVHELLRELGIGSPTIYQWRDKFASLPGMKKSSTPKSRSAAEKLKTLIEFEVLPAAERGEYLRRNGLHEENLVEWRGQIEKALTPAKLSLKERQELFAEQKKVKALEGELRRKDKALAEVSALLILKKKADLLWGTEEDE
jgi:transposase-like protein